MGGEFYRQEPIEKLVSIHDTERIPVKKSDRKSGTFPYYGASGITDYVNDFLFDGNYVLLAEDGDNIRSRKTPIAFMARGRFWVNNHAHILKGTDGNNTDFICYALQIADISSYISGSTRPKITQRDMRKIPIYCPPLPKQNAIAHILGSLDDKIELNRQMNETLEAMAQALFKSWFVDFDPVIDNALAAGNEIPDALKAKAATRQALGDAHKPLPEEIQKQFPNSFEYIKEVGWIPEGWEVKSLGDITTELRRGISPKYIEEGGVRVVNQRCIRNHEVDYSLARRNDENQRKVEGRFLEEADLLINSTGVGTLGRMAQVHTLDEPTVIDSHVTVVRADRSKFNPYTFARMMLSLEPQIEAMGEGSTGQTELSRKNVTEVQTIVPPQGIQNVAEEHFYDLSKKAFFNLQMTNTLRLSRDTLLPKLLSGELRIPDAEKLVKEMA